ncbi:MAG TPA: histidine--tRNA ligase [Tepidisphaeraceae bacterium]|nr:histidine--tRNA ligase [Tepidisphaeraceae bacterium]
MSKIPAPKGFEDILPADSWKWHAIEAIARELGEIYHFQEIRTPVLEHSDLFHRGVGETTDIVHKETFTFKDRGGDSMTLRPEGTAGVVRAAIEHGLIAQEGSRVKVYYIAPNFRYERPQKGRLRQHHQFGAEAFGIADAAQDVECILLQMDFYRRCGIKDLSLQINSLGDAESKQRYRDALVKFLKPKASSLSEDSQRRLEANPLRILDSKDPRDQEASRGAPPPYESLSENSRRHFDQVQKLLTGMADFKVNPNLVRGFDYYTETLWEVTASGLGSQNALGGGGRYDNLVENLGGRPTPGVGFGSGLERLLIALEAQSAQLPKPTKPVFYLVYHGEAAREAHWTLLHELRANDIAADMDLSNRSVKAQFKLADREQATHCLIVGDNELANQTITLKDLKTGQQSTVPRSELIRVLRDLRG